MAGPSTSTDTKHLLAEAQSEFLQDFEYRGSVADGDKHKFYNDIDVFVFPTRYRNEAQPLVLFEAMGHGVPVVAYNRGCIADDLAHAGIAVARDRDFAQTVAPVLAQWDANRQTLESASKTALKRAEQAYAEGQSDLDRLMNELTGGQDQ